MYHLWKLRGTGWMYVGLGSPNDTWFELKNNGLDIGYKQFFLMKV
jgi:hypothetical protein